MESQTTKNAQRNAHKYLKINRPLIKGAYKSVRKTSRFYIKELPTFSRPKEDLRI